jgi:hypothetical protein
MEGRPGRGERSAFNSITRFNGVGFFSWLQWRGMGGGGRRNGRETFMARGAYVGHNADVGHGCFVMARSSGRVLVWGGVAWGASGMPWVARSVRVARRRGAVRAGKRAGERREMGGERE